MEPLSDPLGDRVVPSVQPPPHRPLLHSLLFPRRKSPLVRKPDWKVLSTHLYNEGTVSKADCLELIDLAASLFSMCHLEKERTLLEVRDPITIVGDIHGQFYDLVKLLEVAGSPEEMKYLFLGDYVDRGSFSMEVLMLLFAVKVCYPTTVLMLRGNHECRQMNTFFNFRAECEHLVIVRYF